ncbi:MAG: alpha/beta hydrolase [Cyclobacteriaceae bacterium]
MALERQTAKTWKALVTSGVKFTYSIRYLFNCAVLCALVAMDARAQQPGLPAGSRMINMDGHELHVLYQGLENRKPGRPVIVFEAGLMHSMDVWAKILPQVAIFAPVVAYDRAGLGRSVWNEQTPTPEYITKRLHELLRQVGAEPPYLLVGHSWGGTLARYFAGYHPDDVAGIVYVDPGPIATQSMAEQLAPFDSIGAGKDGYDAMWSGFATALEGASAAGKAELKVMRSLMERDKNDRDLKPAPDVPVVVLMAAKPYPPFLQLPYDHQAHFDADLRHRIRMLQEWALASPKGTLVVSNHTTHAMPREDPDLVMWAIMRVLSAIPTKP